MSTPLKVLSSMAPREVLAELATGCAREFSHGTRLSSFGVQVD
jgi:hypothetical protein